MKMLARVRSRLTYANVMATIAVLLALTGGTAGAARLITGVNVKNESLTGRDVKNGSLKSIDIDTATRASLTDSSPWETMPSGKTVTGMLGDDHTARADGASISTFMQLPLRPPQPLTSANVGFSPGSAPLAAAGDIDATCTGSFAEPTAPAGKLCIYLLSSNNISTVFADAWAEPSAQAMGMWRLLIIDTTGGLSSELRGSWAYTAP